MKIKTSELVGPALDWVVATCDHEELAALSIQYPKQAKFYPKYQPSLDWSLGGPIIDREKIELKYLGYDSPPYWGALKFSPNKCERQAAIGPTPLIAAMRCYCCAKLGEFADIPEELL